MFVYLPTKPIIRSVVEHNFGCGYGRLSELANYLAHI